MKFLENEEISSATRGEAGLGGGKGKRKFPVWEVKTKLFL